MALTLAFFYSLAALPAILAYGLSGWGRLLWIAAALAGLLVELRRHVLGGRVRRLGRGSDGLWFVETARGRREGRLRARLVTEWLCLVQIGGWWRPRTVAVFRPDVSAEAHRRLRRALLERDR